MGLLPQEIELVNHLGYAGHEGSERLQTGKEELIGRQKGWLWTLAKGGAAESAPPRSAAIPEIHSLSEGRESRHSPWGATPRPWRQPRNVNRHPSPLAVATAPERTGNLHSGANDPPSHSQQRTSSAEHRHGAQSANEEGECLLVANKQSICKSPWRQFVSLSSI